MSLPLCHCQFVFMFTQCQGRLWRDGGKKRPDQDAPIASSPPPIRRPRNLLAAAPATFSDMEAEIELLQLGGAQSDHLDDILMIQHLCPNLSTLPERRPTQLQGDVITPFIDFDAILTEQHLPTNLSDIIPSCDHVSRPFPSRLLGRWGDNSVMDHISLPLRQKIWLNSYVNLATLLKGGIKLRNHFDPANQNSWTTSDHSVSNTKSPIVSYYWCLIRLMPYFPRSN